MGETSGDPPTHSGDPTRAAADAALGGKAHGARETPHGRLRTLPSGVGHTGHGSGAASHRGAAAAGRGGSGRRACPRRLPPRPAAADTRGEAAPLPCPVCPTPEGCGRGRPCGVSRAPCALPPRGADAAARVGSPEWVGGLPRSPPWAAAARRAQDN